MFEKENLPLYCMEGRPDLPIQRQVGLLILKSLRNLIDEEIMMFLERKPLSAGFLRGAGVAVGLLCDASELTHFRKCIGTGGTEKILAAKIVQSGVLIGSIHWVLGKWA